MLIHSIVFINFCTYIKRDTRARGSYFVLRLLTKIYFSSSNGGILKMEKVGSFYRKVKYLCHRNRPLKVKRISLWILIRSSKNNKFTFCSPFILFVKVSLNLSHFRVSFNNRSEVPLHKILGLHSKVSADVGTTRWDTSDFHWLRLDFRKRVLKPTLVTGIKRLFNVKVETPRYTDNTVLHLNISLRPSKTSVGEEFLYCLVTNLLSM